MENISFALEVLIIGFVVVMVALFLMAFVLQVFTKVATAGEGKKNLTATAPSQIAAQAPVQDEEEVDEEEYLETEEQEMQQEVAFEPGPVQPEIAAAIAGVFQCMNRPEIVAAAMGALLYVTEPPGISNPGVSQPHKGLWEDAARTRTVDSRQDHALLRKGKL